MNFEYIDILCSNIIPSNGIKKLNYRYNLPIPKYYMKISRDNISNVEKEKIMLRWAFNVVRRHVFYGIYRQIARKYHNWYQKRYHTIVIGKQ
jgi:hypothetical protein